MSGLSSITSLPQMKLFVQESLKSYMQENVIDEDLFSTFKHYRDQLPPMRFDCGTNDLLIKHNQELHEKMDKAGIPHIYEEYPGAHEWPYWTQHIITSLEFFAQYMRFNDQGNLFHRNISLVENVTIIIKRSGRNAWWAPYQLSNYQSFLLNENHVLLFTTTDQSFLRNETKKPSCFAFK